MNDLDKILDGLLQRTTDGKLKWSRTAEADQFVTSVDTISVIVRRKVVHTFPGVSTPEFQLEILDAQGTSIETIGLASGGATPDRQRKLPRLYDLARRSALNIQETLEKLAKALES